jgi:hypothetical protein
MSLFKRMESSHNVRRNKMKNPIFLGIREAGAKPNNLDRLINELSGSRVGDGNAKNDASHGTD